MTEPVSIRAKNPGAQWPGPISKKFGSTEWWPCGGNNKIAVFSTFEQGGAATLYLWANKYSDMPLSAAIYKWSGQNSSKAYADFLHKRVPEITLDTQITRALLNSPTGVQFMIAQSQWEAGKVYPMTEAQWQKAQEIAFGAKAPKPVKVVDAEVVAKPAIKSKTIWSTVIGVVTSVGAALTDWKIAAVLIGGALIAFIIWDRKGKPDITGFFK
jgi:hypothetical protein